MMSGKLCKQIVGISLIVFSLFIMTIKTCLASEPGVTYEELGVPGPTTPTADRPYYLLTFDKEMKTEYPYYSPLDLDIVEINKLVIYNYIDQSKQYAHYSDYQTEVIEGALKDLAPMSNAKELMLVNIVVTDENNESVYGPSYGAAYEGQNMMGYDRETPSQTAILPWSVVMGSPLTENGGRTLADFSIMHRAKHNNDIKENAKGIRSGLYLLVHGYNDQQLGAEKEKEDAN